MPGQQPALRAGKGGGLRGRDAHGPRTPDAFHAALDLAKSQADARRHALKALEKADEKRAQAPEAWQQDLAPAPAARPLPTGLERRAPAARPRGVW